MANSTDQIVDTGTSHTDAHNNTSTILLRDEQASKGIAQTEDLIKFIANFAGFMKNAKSDGKIDLMDLMSAVTLAPSLLSAINGAGGVPAELKSMTGEEKDQLITDMKNAVLKLVDALT